MECVFMPFSRDFPNPGIEPWSPALQADYLPLNDFLDVIHLMSRKARIKKKKKSRMNIRKIGQRSENNQVCIIFSFLGLFEVLLS